MSQTLPAYSPVADLTTYTTRMGRGIVDKLFFVDKIEPDLVVDFGCADGVLIDYLRPWYPDAKFIGYDIDSGMLDAARLRLPDKRFTFTDHWQEVADAVNWANAEGRKTALVLSSVVHEVYHYSEPIQVTSFWDRVFGSGFKYIVLRDMIPGRSIDRPSNPRDVARVYAGYLRTQTLQDFEQAWGSVESNRNLIHFLLKCQYEEPNWQREVKENYFPLYREELLSMVPPKYMTVYHEHFVLPYVWRTMRKQLGIDIVDPTHLKLVLELE